MNAKKIFDLPIITNLRILLIPQLFFIIFNNPLLWDLVNLLDPQTNLQILQEIQWIFIKLTSTTDENNIKILTDQTKILENSINLLSTQKLNICKEVYF